MIDLKEQYGKRYKVTLDESWDVERDRKAADRPWYEEIKGKRGWCYLHNRSVLSVEISNRVFNAYQHKMPFPYSYVRGGDETQKVLVEEEHIAKAINFIIPRRKRMLSEAHKAKLLAASAKFRFPAGSK